MREQSGTIHVLLVDDEEEFLRATAPALSRRGYTVATARSGEEALALLAQRPFDAVVLDVKMPGMGGEELFHRLQKERPELPAVMLTGHGTVQQAFRTSRQGLVDYLTKPCDIDELAASIRSAITSWRPPREEDASSRIRLLIVDDEEDLLSALSAVLTRRGMDVLTAPNGAAALEILSAHRIDVAIVDIKMPGIGGIELLELIKQRHPGVEVIILTGHPTTATAFQGTKKGAYDYVIKPPDVDGLAEVVRKAFTGSRLLARESVERIIRESTERIPD
jgi:DNA-binding NtrC family response regulator